MKKTTLILSIVLVLTLCFAATGGASSLFDLFNQKEEDTVTISKQEYDSLKKYEKLEEIYQYITQMYYQEPDEKKMMEYAIQGMLSSLDDPYTFYYNPDDWAAMQEDDEGTYVGIGCQLLGNYQENTVTITRVFRDTPAEKAGILRGDVLVRVDDIMVDATTMQEAVNVMRGALGESVEVEVSRGGENIVFTIIRAENHINREEHMMLENNVGYIVLYEFQGDCAEMVAKAVEELVSAGATSLILDLRDNGGGWVNSAVSIADIFLDKQLLVYAVDRYGYRDESWTTDGMVDMPLIVLVNEYSASSSEILAGGLQNAGRATVMGTQSYGKGIIQYVIALDGEPADGFQFTVAQYYLPDGTVVHKVGITPDIIVEIPEDVDIAYLQTGDMTDPQLKAAWEEAIRQAEAK